MLKKIFAVLTAVLCVLMLFSGCVPALPANLEENSAEIKLGTTYIGSGTIFRSSLSSFIGPSYAKYEITEDSLIYKFDEYSEGKIFPVEKWEWEEFPYTEEEWNGLFLVPEEIFDIFQYGKIMYQPITELSSFLLVNGEIWFMNITPINSEDHPFLISNIERLIPEDSCGSAQFEYAPALSSREPFFDFKMDMEFTRISVSGGEGRLVDIDKPYFQLGYNIVIDDHDFIRWSPMDYDGKVSEQAEFDFCIYQNGDNSSWVYSGKIIISSEESKHGRFYSAKLISNDLYLSQDKDGSGGIISIKK